MKATVATTVAIVLEKEDTELELPREVHHDVRVGVLWDESIDKDIDILGIDVTEVEERVALLDHRKLWGHFLQDCGLHLQDLGILPHALIPGLRTDVESAILPLDITLKVLALPVDRGLRIKKSQN